MTKRRTRRDCRPYRYRACVAIHEAAHAVAAVVFKRNLKRVTIVPARGFSGACWAGGSMRTRAQRDAEVILCLAGFAIEIAVIGDFDEHDTANLYAFNLEQGHEDLVEAERIMRRDKLDVKSPRVVALSNRFRDFFAEHREAIVVLAGALIEARTLTAVEVRRVLRSV